MNFSPTPWQVELDRVITDTRGRQVAIAVNGDDARAEPDARRIVQCVNWLDGVPDAVIATPVPIPGPPLLSEVNAEVETILKGAPSMQDAHPAHKAASRVAWLEVQLCLEVQRRMRAERMLAERIRRGIK